MAGDKTEAPTPKRKREARKKGQIPRSTEVVSWGGLLVASMLLRTTVVNSARAVQDTVQHASVAMAAGEVSAALDVARFAAAAGMLALAPLLGGLMVAGIVLNVAQVGLATTTSQIKPQFSRVNPFAGVKRLFSVHGVWELGKSVAKVLILIVLVWLPLWSLARSLMSSDPRPLTDIIVITGQQISTTFRNVALVGLVIAGVDYGFSRNKIMKQIRMTKQEVRDEHRLSEGDPQVKAQIRSRQLAASRNRMLADVADASAVIVNPTEIALAVRYQPGTGAPRVVAKGSGALAAKIRERATDAGVPILRDVPMARTLHRLCEVGDEIPAEMYNAVAQLLAFLFAVKRHTIVDVHTPTRSFLDGGPADRLTGPLPRRPRRRRRMR